MVKLHRAEVPSVIPVKRPRRSSLLTRTPVCLWPGCGAALAHDHDRPVCGCHVSPRYNPRHDRDLAAKIRHIVLAAYPAAVDLCVVFRCSSGDLQAAIRYLNRRRESLGGRIVGARRGYVFQPARVVHRVGRR